ncbi:hypothetical protein ACGF0D_29540 [Kitasatospora sp. NPDC048298]|uniref:hypothetical protein n=1 Tax=Kitasatospora sp. NPDC048298 TaxID=3364049 RepID=UPI00371A9EE2
MSDETPWRQWHAKAPRCPAGVNWEAFIGRRLEITDGWRGHAFRPEKFRGVVVPNGPGTADGCMTFDDGFVFNPEFWDIYDLERGDWLRFTVDGRELIEPTMRPHRD